MANITKLNWNELDGTIADVNDIKPIADKVDESIDVLNPLDDEVVNARGTFSDLKSRLDDSDNKLNDVRDEVATARGGFTTLNDRLNDYNNRITSNENDISTLFSAVEARSNYKGDWDSTDPNKVAQLGELWRYNNKFWISLENNNTDDPDINSSKWALWDNISDYVLNKPILSDENELYENSTLDITITNYQADYTYTVTSSDTNLLNGSVNGNIITLTSGDITDNQDHVVNITVFAAKEGWLYNSTTKAITVKYLPAVQDQSAIFENTTYIADNFDEINDGSII